MGGLSLDPKKAKEQSEKIARMRELTNADESTARFWLESYSWDLERVREVVFGGHVIWVETVSKLILDSRAFDSFNVVAFATIPQATQEYFNKN